MSETIERPEEKSDAKKATGDSGKAAQIATPPNEPGRRRHMPLVMAITAIVAIAGVALALWWQRSSGGAGRPVPAPRTITIDQTSSNNSTAPTSAEPTLTLAPEQVQRAGIKVEPVGEQLASEGSTGGVATGVVQPNAYRETPVMSLVGGIVRSVGAELGQNVKSGQTLAVVFSKPES